MPDPVVLELIRRQGAGKSIDQVRALIRETFPERRAPAASTVAYWLVQMCGPARRRRPSVVRKPGAKLGPSPKLERDAEIAAFVRQQAAGRTIDQVRALCVERFGATRVPSRTALGRFWKDLPVGKFHGRRGLRADDELRAFVRRHQEGRTIDQVRALCVEKFGTERTPSHSSLGRYTQRLPGEKSRGRQALHGDAELLAFAREHRGGMTLDALRAAMIERFPGRVIPSRSALGRVRVSKWKQADV